MNQQPQDTLKQLCELFPEFQAWWEKDADHPPSEDALVDGVYYQWTHHSVMAEFLGFFSTNHQAFSDAQLRQFGAWVNGALEAKGDLENAISTCFLEHARQVKINRVLAPYLSRGAKRNV